MLHPLETLGTEYQLGSMRYFRDSGSHSDTIKTPKRQTPSLSSLNRMRLNSLGDNPDFLPASPICIPENKKPRSDSQDSDTILKNNMINQNLYESETESDQEPYTPEEEYSESADEPSESIKIIDTDKNPEYCYLSCDTTKIPHPSLFKSINVPIGFHYRPMCPTVDEDTVPLMDYGRYPILRCPNCKAYGNPFDKYIKNGRRYICSICHMQVEVPSYIYSSLDDYGKRIDLIDHPDFCKGQVEYIASSEYMLRPPQSPVYIILIELSSTLEKYNILQVIMNSLKLFIKNIPNKKSQIAIITFNSSIQFYNFSSKRNKPEIVVIDLEDLDDISNNKSSDNSTPLLQYDSLLCRISQIEPQLEYLCNNIIESLPIGDNSNNKSCLGVALKCVYEICKNTGGKLLLFVTNTPSVGNSGVIDGTNITNSQKDYYQNSGYERIKMLNNMTPTTADTFYLDLSSDFINKKISVDLFYLMRKDYNRFISTILPLISYTGGHIYYFDCNDIRKSDTELYNTIYNVFMMETAWETILGIRISKGFKIKKIYGNYHQRKEGLLNIANVNKDTLLSIEIDGIPKDLKEIGNSIDECVIQFGLIYTNNKNQRRVRVFTMSLPIAITLPDIYESINIKELVTLLSKHTLTYAMNNNSKYCQELCHQNCIDIIKYYRRCFSINNNQLPPSLQYLPYYSLALQKNYIFQHYLTVGIDSSLCFCNILFNYNTEDTLLYYTPIHYRLDDLDENNYGLYITSPTATNNNNNSGSEVMINMPQPLSLSYMHYTSSKIILLYTTQTIYIWIGSSITNEQFYNLFGFDISLIETHANPEDDIPLNVYNILCSNENKALFNIITVLQNRRTFVPPFVFIREGSEEEIDYKCLLIEDNNNNSSYFNYINQVMKETEM